MYNLANGDGGNTGSKPPPFKDTEVVFGANASKESKAAWARFFEGLEIWRQKQRHREMLPGVEPPPPRDMNWGFPVMNSPEQVLSGTAPPVPPGFPRLTKEQAGQKLDRERNDPEMRRMVAEMEALYGYGRESRRSGRLSSEAVSEGFLDEANEQEAVSAPRDHTSDG